jgi:general transcription factor 3C polypeptide 3 (transcription factor C subunit 4)
MHQFRLEPILLLQSALQGGGTAAHQVWCTLALQRYVHRELRLYEDAIDGQGMSFSKRHQRWTVPPKIGISRLLDEEHFFDGGERKGDEDDDAPLAVGRKGRKSGVEPRKSVKAVSADATLGDALDEEEGMEEEEEDVEGGEDEDEESRETIRPTQVSPAWCAVYGQFLLASGSHHGALCKSSPCLIGPWACRRRD